MEQEIVRKQQVVRTIRSKDATEHGALRVVTCCENIRVRWRTNYEWYERPLIELYIK